MVRVVETSIAFTIPLDAIAYRFLILISAAPSDMNVVNIHSVNISKHSAKRRSQKNLKHSKRRGCPQWTPLTYYFYEYQAPNDEDESQNAVTINQFKKEDDGDQLRNLKPRLDICLQPKLEGPCRASVPSYFYNADSEDCEPFDYGGCHGNDNRFRSVSECRARCTNSVRDDKPTPPPPEQFESNIFHTFN